MDIWKPSFRQILSKMDRPSSAALPGLRSLRTRYIAAVEKDYLVELMKCTSGDVSLACRISGLSRSRLYALLHKHALARHM